MLRSIASLNAAKIQDPVLDGGVIFINVSCPLKIGDTSAQVPADQFWPELIVVIALTVNLAAYLCIVTV